MKKLLLTLLFLTIATASAAQEFTPPVNADMGGSDRKTFPYEWDGQTFRPQLNGVPISLCTEADITNDTASPVIPTQGENARVMITAMTIQNSHATQKTWVEILDGSTIRWKCLAGAVDGGCNLSFPTPLLGSIDTAWSFRNVTTAAATQGCLSGFILYDTTP